MYLEKTHNSGARPCGTTMRELQMNCYPISQKYTVTHTPGTRNHWRVDFSCGLCVGVSAKRLPNVELA